MNRRFSVVSFPEVPVGAVRIVRKSACDPVTTLDETDVEGIWFHTGHYGSWNADPDRIVEDEARVLLGIRHSAFPRVLEFGRDALTKRAYFVRERIEGETWRSRLQRGLRIELGAMLGLARTLRDVALDGTLPFHGDLKPDNVLYDVLMRVRIIDPSSGSYGLNHVLTTPRYNIYFEHSDVGAFGMLMFEALTGVHPYDVPPVRPGGPGERKLEGKFKVANRDDEGRLEKFLRIGFDGFREPWGAIALKCIGAEVNGNRVTRVDRYASMSEIVADLEKITQWSEEKPLSTVPVTEADRRAKANVLIAEYRNRQVNASELVDVHRACSAISDVATNYQSHMVDGRFVPGLLAVQRFHLENAIESFVRRAGQAAIASINPRLVLTSWDFAHELAEHLDESDTEPNIPAALDTLLRAWEDERSSKDAEIMSASIAISAATRVFSRLMLDPQLVDDPWTQRELARGRAALLKAGVPSVASGASAFLERVEVSSKDDSLEKLGQDFYASLDVQSVATYRALDLWQWSLASLRRNGEPCYRFRDLWQLLDRSHSDETLPFVELRDPSHMPNRSLVDLLWRATKMAEQLLRVDERTLK